MPFRHSTRLASACDSSTRGSILESIETAACSYSKPTQRWLFHRAKQIRIWPIVFHTSNASSKRSARCWLDQPYPLVHELIVALRLRHPQIDDRIDLALLLGEDFHHRIEARGLRGERELNLALLLRIAVLIDAVRTPRARRRPAWRRRSDVCGRGRCRRCNRRCAH